MKKLLQEIRKSVKRGNFTLKSGKSSDYYLDVRSLYGNPTTLFMIAKSLAQKIPKGATCIAASGYGGISIGTMVSHITKLPLCLVRNEKKSHGLADRIVGYRPTKNDRVVIADDVCSSGTSILETKKILATLKPKNISALVLVKRGNPKGRISLDYVFLIEEILGE